MPAFGVAIERERAIIEEQGMLLAQLRGALAPPDETDR